MELSLLCVRREKRCVDDDPSAPPEKSTWPTPIDGKNSACSPPNDSGQNTEDLTRAERLYMRVPLSEAHGRSSTWDPPLEMDITWESASAHPPEDFQWVLEHACGTLAARLLNQLGQVRRHLTKQNIAAKL